MPRGNRYYIPGMIWHITHRCHKKEFLLKFARDRRRWIRWLYEAKKRFGLRILNYTVTSNHIHLLTQDTGQRETLPRSLQLIAGRTAQEYNIRKHRKGAFWEDRFHATAVQEGEHLIRCLVYIDLNMVRTGIVSHPSEWCFCGYNEIQNPPKRYSLIDRKLLMALIGIHDSEKLKGTYQNWVDKTLRKGGYIREEKWTQSIAVGNKLFVERVKDKLGFKAVGRKVVSTGDDFELKEREMPYNSHFDHEKRLLRQKINPKWNIYPLNTV